MIIAINQGDILDNSELSESIKYVLFVLCSHPMPCIYAHI